MPCDSSMLPQFDRLFFSFSAPRRNLSNLQLSQLSHSTSGFAILDFNSGFTAPFPLTASIAKHGMAPCLDAHRATRNSNPQLALAPDFPSSVT